MVLIGVVDWSRVRLEQSQNMKQTPQSTNIPKDQDIALIRRTLSSSTARNGGLSGEFEKPSGNEWRNPP